MEAPAEAACRSRSATGSASSTGARRNDPHGDPVHELVLTILSQNTSDGNRDVAYRRLRDAARGLDPRSATRRPRTWIEAIRPGGLADIKGPRIQHVLAGLGDPDLDWLREAPREEAIAYLTAMPGVGRKTAACVMIFAFDRPEIPVDTHVHRVGGRLGLFPTGIGLEAAHDEMLAITDREDAYELHMNLIRTDGASAGGATAVRGVCARRGCAPTPGLNQNSTSFAGNYG